MQGGSSAQRGKGIAKGARVALRSGKQSGGIPAAATRCLQLAGNEQALKGGAYQRKGKRHGGRGGERWRGCCGGLRGL